MKQLFVSFICLLYCSSFMVGQAAVDIIDLKIAYNETALQYEVYMQSDNDVNPALVGSSQITVVFPDSIDNGILNNMDITSVFPMDWAQNTTLFDLGSTYPTYPYDYYAVATQGGQYIPGTGITAGVEILLFTFTVDGGCIEGIRLFDHFIDPLSDPDTTGGLDFENNIALQTPDGPVEAYDYLYGDPTPDCFLPVELLSFNAKKGNGLVELTWVTASEINNDFFEVQRSVDGREFRTIGKVDGKGTTFSKSNYILLDKAPQESNYYRLRQVDLDKTEDYSDIRFVGFQNEKGETKFDIFPNPFLNEITIDLGTIDAYQLELYDAAGNAVVKQAYVSGQTIDLSNIPSGSYTIRVYDVAGNELLVKTIIKANRS